MLSAAARLMGERRSMCLTCAQCMAEVSNVETSNDGYDTKRARRTAHVVLGPFAIDEPTEDSVVDVLAALPAEDRDYYVIGGGECVF